MTLSEVLLEPIGERITCGPEETVLEAAFRHGFDLAHGCREGHCSACKAYLLEGEVVLRPHSTFALSEDEEHSGYTLLCRAMPEDDLVVELLHFDPDDYRLAEPIRDVDATVVSVEAATRDIRRLRLRVPGTEGFSFAPGQHVDVWIPGTDLRRSYSMANLAGDGEIELLVRRYPDGRFSRLLDGGLASGSALRVTGPYGSLRLRRSDRPLLLIAGGSGIAPVLALLRQLAAEHSSRQVRLVYGVRTRADLLDLGLLEDLGARLANFRLVAALSEPDATDRWEGRHGLVHEAVDACLAAGELEDPHVYMAGPPPMIDCVTEILTARHGVDEDVLFVDRFTPATGLEEPVRVRP